MTNDQTIPVIVSLVIGQFSLIAEESKIQLRRPLTHPAALALLAPPEDEEGDDDEGEFDGESDHGSGVGLALALPNQRDHNALDHEFAQRN